MCCRVGRETKPTSMLQPIKPTPPGAKYFFIINFSPFPPRLQTIIWNELHVLNLEKLLGPVDVYHSPDWSLAPTKAKTVITVHDLFFLKRPDLQQHPYQATLERRLQLAKDRQAQVIAVSQATKNDLIELLDYPEELIKITYEAVDDKFKMQNANLKIKQIKKKYGIEGNYLLMVATQEPRKNLERTIEAFNSLVSGIKRNARQNSVNMQNTNLVIVGKVGWGNVGASRWDALPQPRTRASHRLAPTIRFIGYVPQEELPTLYSGSEGFLYPSLYEGFGIPILEAFACGVPVLTSNVSSMPEVAGKAAIYVDPYKTDSIREGLEKMLNLSTTDKNELIQNGYKQMKKFSWGKVAKETLKMYKT